jgi:hypothetical protein
MSDYDITNKTLFEQHWLHARHVETLRLALLSVYVVILSGFIAAEKDTFFKRDFLWARIFLVILSLWCIALCMKFNAIFKKHTDDAEGLLQNKHKMLPQLPKRTLGKLPSLFSEAPLLEFLWSVFVEPDFALFLPAKVNPRMVLYNSRGRTYEMRDVAAEDSQALESRRDSWK